MERLAADLYHWLKSHNIDTEKVALIVRANDEMTLAQVEAATRRDLSPLMFHPKEYPPDLKQMKLHGMRVSVSSLDRR